MVKKQIFLFLMLGLFMISFTSALTLTDPSTWDDEVKFHETSPNGKYGYYEIADTFLWIFNKKQIKTVELIENDYSVFTAWNIKQIEVFQPTKLFDKTEYFGLDKITDKSNHIKSETQLYRQWINSSEEKEINISCDSYKDLVNENGTTEVCIDWNTEFITIDTSHWTEWEIYNWNSKQPGLYQTKTIVTRDYQNTGIIDWVDTSEGHKLDEWATWWNNSWEFKRNITSLNGSISSIYNITYDADMKNDFSDLRFLDYSTESIELDYGVVSKTDGTSIMIRVNNFNQSNIMMYYGNPVATSTASMEDVYYNPVAGYYFDTANPNDFTTNGNNGLLKGGVSFTTAGFIDGAYDYDGINDHIDLVSPSYSGDHTVTMTVKFEKADFGALYMTGTTTSWGFMYEPTANNFVVYPAAISTVFNLDDGSFHTVSVVQSGSNALVYIDGNLENTIANTNTIGAQSLIGIYGTIANYQYEGIIDEVYIHNSALNSTLVRAIHEQTKPSFIVGAEQEISGISTDLLFPIDNEQTDSQQVEFSVNSISTGFAPMDNVTLSVWNITDLIVENLTLIDSNTSIITNWTYNFTQGNYIWNAETCGDSTCGLSENRSFIIHFTEPKVDITAPTGISDYFKIGDNETLIYNISEIGENETEHFVECWVEYNNTEVLPNSSSSFDGSTQIFEFPSEYTNVTKLTVTNSTFEFLNINEGCSRRGNFTIRAELNGPSRDLYCVNQSNQNIFIGTVEPATITVINITSNQKRPLNCIENNYSFEYVEDKNSLSVHAIDEFGLHAQNVTTWNYTTLELSTTYNSNITEGEINQISVKLVLDVESSITNSVINYGGINYTTSVIYDGENYTIISNNNAPIVIFDTNFSFNFIISVDGINHNTTVNNQTVLNLDFSICGGVSNDTLLNMSLFDEGTLSSLIGDMEFNADIISKTSNEIIETINGSFNNVHYGSLCFSPVSSYSMYYLDTEIRYFEDGYVTEFYHIQKADLSDYPSNLSLFDLNQSDSTEFSTTYKNNNFIFTEGAVIQLQRKYIGEDIYRVVEAPITSDGGKTILHIDLNTNKYQASVVKDGELLDFFDNIVFSCDNELSGDCTHSLQGTVNPNNDVQIVDITDFSYSVSVDESNQTITVLFAVPSGTPSSINVLLEQIDMFGNSTACNTTIITSAGSITCDYVDTIEKSILELSISKNDVQLAVLSYANDPELDMDGMNFFIVFLFMISLVGMAIASPEWMIIISVMILVISGTMLLINGMNLVMGLGSIAWVIIAAAIIIFKMAKQEDR